MYKQELNCNLVGCYEAVEKTVDLFRPVVTRAVLFLSACFFFYFVHFLLYTCIPALAYSWYLCSYVNKYINNY